RRCAAPRATAFPASPAVEISVRRGAPVTRTEHVADLASVAVKLAGTDRDLAGRLCALRKAPEQRRAILSDALRLFAKQPRHLTQHVDKSRTAVARLLRKISTAPNGLARGREKHGQRPAALLAQRVQRRHVDLI